MKTANESVEGEQITAQACGSLPPPKLRLGGCSIWRRSAAKDYHKYDVEQKGDKLLIRPHKATVGGEKPWVMFNLLEPGVHSLIGRTKTLMVMDSSDVWYPEWMLRCVFLCYCH